MRDITPRVATRETKIREFVMDIMAVSDLGIVMEKGEKTYEIEMRSYCK